MKLHISDDLSIPLEAVTQTFAVLAKRGAGKSYLAAASGYALGGAFNNPKGRLRTLGLIEYPAPSRARARSILFLE